MHILIVNYAYAPDIQSAHALLQRYHSLTGWAEGLIAAGASGVTVLQRFKQDAYIQQGHIDYIFCADGGGPFPRPWTFPRRLLRAAGSLHHDVAHVNGLVFPAQIGMLRRSLPRQAALLAQHHANDPRETRSAADGLRHAMLSSGLRTVDGFLFVTAAQAQPWRAAGLVAPHQRVYEVMEASTPIGPLPRDAARVASGLRGEPALLWVGRLNHNKDPLTVLEGFAQALPQLPGAHLTMLFSTMDLLPQVEARLASSPLLAERVHLRGCVPHCDIATFHSAADLFVLGSHHEAGGYALLEAIACGTVPVVTDIPSFRAITAGGQVGALWPPGDAAALAAALACLGQCNLDTMRCAMAAHFERELSWPAIGRRALAAYEDASIRRKDKVRWHAAVSKSG